MVALVRRGLSRRAVARRFQVSLPTVHRGVKRAQGRRLDRGDGRAHASRPHRTRRTAECLEELVRHVRQELPEQRARGTLGAAASARALTRRGHVSLPSGRTMGRILARGGVLNARRRPRPRPPPRGWYRPAVAARAAAIARVDVVEGLGSEGGR
jgi:hypothetical protein